MHPARIAELLQPFAPPLSGAQLAHISTYINILERWNARLNLTAVRRPESIVTRHFGESIFAARHLFPPSPPATCSTWNTPAPSDCSTWNTGPTVPRGTSGARLIDVGSGAGFPGLPIKLWAPALCVTLLESNHKKASFLREVVRTLQLDSIQVLAVRAEEHSPASAETVTLRAVEHFARILPVAASLLAPSGRLALLIGASQVAAVKDTLRDFAWQDPAPIPLASARVLLLGSHR